MDSYPSAQGQGQDPVSGRDRIQCHTGPGEGRKAVSFSRSTQEDFLEEDGRAVQFFHALGLAEGGSSLVLGFLVLAGAADTENPTRACEGVFLGEQPWWHRPHVCLFR